MTIIGHTKDEDVRLPAPKDDRSARWIWKFVDFDPKSDRGQRRENGRPMMKAKRESSRRSSMKPPIAR